MICANIYSGNIWSAADSRKAKQFYKFVRAFIRCPKGEDLSKVLLITTKYVVSRKEELPFLYKCTPINKVHSDNLDGRKSSM